MVFITAKVQLNQISLTLIAFKRVWLPYGATRVVAYEMLYTVRVTCYGLFSTLVAYLMLLRNFRWFWSPCHPTQWGHSPRFNCCFHVYLSAFLAVLVTDAFAVSLRRHRWNLLNERNTWRECTSFGLRTSHCFSDPRMLFFFVYLFTEKYMSHTMLNAEIREVRSHNRGFYKPGMPRVGMVMSSFCSLINGEQFKQFSPGGGWVQVTE